MKELVAGSRYHRENGSSICCSPVQSARRQQVPTQLEISPRRMPVQLHPKQLTAGLHQMKLECCNTINQCPHGLLLSPTPKFQGNLLNSVFKGILLGLGQLLG